MSSTTRTLYVIHNGKHEVCTVDADGKYSATITAPTGGFQSNVDLETYAICHFTLKCEGYDINVIGNDGKSKGPYFDVSSIDTKLPSIQFTMKKESVDQDADAIEIENVEICNLTIKFEYNTTSSKWETGIVDDGKQFSAPYDGKDITLSVIPLYGISANITNIPNVVCEPATYKKLEETMTIVLKSSTFVKDGKVDSIQVTGISGDTSTSVTCTQDGEISIVITGIILVKIFRKLLLLVLTQRHRVHTLFHLVILAVYQVHLN